MQVKLRYYMVIGSALGVASAIGDGLLHTPNPIPYMTGGAGFIGDFAYLFLLILGKWVD